MNVTATPAPKSSILLEIEVPSDRLDRAIREATRAPVAAYARRRLPARQGAAPHPGARPRADRRPRRGRRAARPGCLPRRRPRAGDRPLTNADVELVEAEEGKPLRFKATVQVRPEVDLGDYANFNFAPEIEAIDAAKVDKVVEELRDQNATLAAGRGPRGRRTATGPSSASPAPGTACRSRAGPRSGCPWSSARTA